MISRPVFLAFMNKYYTEKAFFFPCFSVAECAMDGPGLQITKNQVYVVYKNQV